MKSSIQAFTLLIVIICIGCTTSPPELIGAASRVFNLEYSHRITFFVPPFKQKFVDVNILEALGARGFS